LATAALFTNIRQAGKACHGNYYENLLITEGKSFIGLAPLVKYIESLNLIIAEEESVR
jgi:hypothetical protein